MIFEDQYKKEGAVVKQKDNVLRSAFAVSVALYIGALGVATIDFYNRETTSIESPSDVSLPRGFVIRP